MGKVAKPSQALAPATESTATTWHVLPGHDTCQQWLWDDKGGNPPGALDPG
eukprot:gene8297-2095_t